jgi:hypothetical protein
VVGTPKFQRNLSRNSLCSPSVKKRWVPSARAGRTNLQVLYKNPPIWRLPPPGRLHARCRRRFKSGPATRTIRMSSLCAPVNSGAGRPGCPTVFALGVLQDDGVVAAQSSSVGRHTAKVRDEWATSSENQSDHDLLDAAARGAVRGGPPATPSRCAFRRTWCRRPATSRSSSPRRPLFVFGFVLRAVNSLAPARDSVSLLSELDDDARDLGGTSYVRAGARRGP